MEHPRSFEDMFLKPIKKNLMLRRGNLCRVSPLEDTSVGSTSSSPPSPDPEEFRRHSLERVRGGGCCEIRQFQQRKTNKTQIPIHVFELSSSFYTAGALKIDNNVRSMTYHDFLATLGLIHDLQDGENFQPGDLEAQRLGSFRRSSGSSSDRR